MSLVALLSGLSGHKSDVDLRTPRIYYRFRFQPRRYEQSLMCAPNVDLGEGWMV